MSLKVLLGICLIAVFAMDSRANRSGSGTTRGPSPHADQAADAVRFRRSRAVGMAVTEKVNGSCFTSSSASASRPDAWRCSVGQRNSRPVLPENSGRRENNWPARWEARGPQM